MTLHTIATGPIKVIKPGALPGFEARCTCGYRMTTSLSERDAQAAGAAHVAWAQKAGK
jgi:hypothetical protein